MDTDQNQPLFGLNIDETIKSHLNEAARWGKFLAVMGFIVCALILIGGIFLATSINNVPAYNRFYERDTAPGLGTAAIIVYVLVAVLYFFPCLFLLRFSDKMKIALRSNDPANLTISFQNLKILFRYVGILTIIVISIYLLAFIIGVLGSSR